MPRKMSNRNEVVDERLGRLEEGMEQVKGGMEEMKKAIISEVKNLLEKKGDGGQSSGSNESHEQPQTMNATRTMNDKLEEFRLSAKKVELPAFDGFDPMAWITRAEMYFEVQRTFEEVKIQLAKLSVEGHTIHWFSLWKESIDEVSWDCFKEALLARFGAGRLDNPFEELKEIKQRGSVNDYIEEFEVFSSQCGRLPEQKFLGYFVGGL